MDAHMDAATDKCQKTSLYYLDGRIDRLANSRPSRGDVEQFYFSTYPCVDSVSMRSRLNLLSSKYTIEPITTGRIFKEIIGYKLTPSNPTDCPPY
jgi:hypothetical protein